MATKYYRMAQVDPSEAFDPSALPLPMTGGRIKVNVDDGAVLSTYPTSYVVFHTGLKPDGSTPTTGRVCYRSDGVKPLANNIYSEDDAASEAASMATMALESGGEVLITPLKNKVTHFYFLGNDDVVLDIRPLPQEV